MWISFEILRRVRIKPYASSPGVSMRGGVVFVLFLTFPLFSSISAAHVSALISDFSQRPTYGYCRVDGGSGEGAGSWDPFWDPGRTIPEEHAGGFNIDSGGNALSSIYSENLTVRECWNGVLTFYTNRAAEFTRISRVFQLERRGKQPISFPLQIGARSIFCARSIDEMYGGIRRRDASASSLRRL
jgi:hypothetical protein